MTRLAVTITITLLLTNGLSAQEPTLVSQERQVEQPPAQELGSQPEQAGSQPAASTRAGLIEQEQADKAASLTAAQPDKAEAYVTRISDVFLAGQMHWHAFFRSAYSGGGFTMGAGYTQFVSPYNTIDTRGSITFSGYKRLESEFLAPQLFGRRAVLSVIGGWREATQVGFYGIGLSSTLDARTNFSFQQPYGSATLTMRPNRDMFFVRGGFEVTQWRQNPGSGDFPSVETKYTPDTLPGLGAHPSIWRPSSSWAG